MRDTPQLRSQSIDTLHLDQEPEVQPRFLDADELAQIQEVGGAERTGWLWSFVLLVQLEYRPAGRHGYVQDHQSKSFRTSGGLLDSRPRAKAIAVIAEDADGVLIPLLVLGKSSDHGDQHNHPVSDVRYQLMQ